MRASLAWKTGLAFFAVALPALAGVIPVEALPMPNRVANADVVVIGKITAIEEKTVAAAAAPGAKNKTEYTIAVLTVTEALGAPKSSRTIRLGYVQLAPNVRVNPRPFQAAVGMEGIFFLKRHGEGDFCTVIQLGFVAKDSQNFEKDSALVKRCTKILETPNDFLRSKDAEDRFLAAAMLLTRYRARTSPAARTEPIDAEQSKLILRALATADWTVGTDANKLNPRFVLGRLGLTEKDGWSPPAAKDQKAFADYAQKWLAEHAETYRIQKFVAEKSKS